MTETEIMNRLEKLEGDNRRMKRLGAIAVLVAAALGLMAATRPVPQKITAHEFDVVDGTGRVRIRLGTRRDGGASVGILDTEGVEAADVSWSKFLGPAIQLGFRKVALKGAPPDSFAADIVIADQHLSGPSIMIGRGGSVGPSVNLGVTVSGQPNVMLADSKGHDRADISLIRGAPSLELYNEDGRGAVNLTSLTNGASLEFIGSQNQKIGKFSYPVYRMQLSTWGLDFDDKNGTSAISLGGVKPGSPGTALRSLSFYDAGGDERAAVNVTQGMPTLTLSDAQGFRMDMGSTGEVNEISGATQKTSAASIVMFGNDKKNHVIWKAP